MASIKDYFVDIDNKMKSLCHAIDSACNSRPEFTHSNTSATFHPKQETLQTLSEKISNLENSLQKTQENERKLVEIIEGICQKHEIREQPTLIKNDPVLKQVFDERRNSQYHPTTPLEHNPSNFSIHQKLNGLM